MKTEEITPAEIEKGNVLIGMSGSKFKVLDISPSMVCGHRYLTVEDEDGNQHEHDTVFTSGKLKREIPED